MLYVRCPSLRRFVFLFVSGLIIGMVLSFIHVSLSLPGLDTSVYQQLIQTGDAPSLATILEMNAEDKMTTTNLILNLISAILAALKLRDARRDAQEVRVLCWVMTTLSNHEVKAKHVKRTWGQHCNLLVFISDHEDASLPAVPVLDALEGRSGLWGKTMFGFTHVHDKYKGQYDWVYKADDDTFAIIENMRKFLLPHPPDDSIYFGFRYKPHVANGYMSGGPGYVLSRMAVERVVKVFKNKTEGCPEKSNNNAEDINIAKCLGVAGVKTGDSRDLQGRHRFLPFNVADHVNPDQSKKSWWYWVYMYWPIREGYACCSPDPVSFHYISPAMQHFLYFLVYKVNPVSVNNLAVATPPSAESTTLNGTLSTLNNTLNVTRTPVLGQNVTVVPLLGQNVTMSQAINVTVTSLHAQNVTFATAHNISSVTAPNVKSTSKHAEISNVTSKKSVTKVATPTITSLTAHKIPNITTQTTTTHVTSMSGPHTKSRAHSLRTSQGSKEKTSNVTLTSTKSNLTTNTAPSTTLRTHK